ncbi:MAG: bifunctional phosphoribosyl-AMP cyclohydrolase/phosphoribosyl-ATP diphosphatase HisIE [Elusimicrobiota bacterium]
MNVKKKLIEKLKYNQEGLIPAIIQDASNGQVLMLAYMNRESLKKTLQTGQTCFFSRSRKKLWVKGETSGNTQKVKQILIDCDNDTLLIQVEQKGVACHTGSHSCFYRDIEGEEVPYYKEEKSGDKSTILDELMLVFKDRRKNPSSDSYVCRLMASPGEKMPKKIVEEAAEVLIALKDKDREQIVYETADLWFHTLVALFYHGIKYQDVLEELKRRRQE